MSKSAEIAEIIYEYAGLWDWALLSAGASVPLSTPVCVAVRWRNTGTEALNGRVYLRVIDPYGSETQVTPDLYYATLSSGEETWIYFDNIIFSGEGSYTLDISLLEYGGETPLDAAVVPVSAVYAYVPPVNDGVLGPDTGSVLGFTLVIGITAALVGMMTEAGETAI